MKKKQIVVTGSSGFVGQNLVPYLRNLDNDVKSLSRSQLASKLGFDGCDVIVHLAGKAHDLKKVADPSEYYNVNFELTKKLYDEFLKSDAEKFIFISSVKAAADSLDDVLTENFLANPKTDYGKSKLMAEAYIQSQPLPDGKNFYILRPCMIHGPGNKGNLNLLYQFVKKGIPYPLAAFKNIRSYLSVENLCFILNEIINQKEIPSGVYNVADNEALSTTDVVHILAQSMSKRPLLWKISKTLINTAAKIGNMLKLPLNTERLNKLTENYEVSNKKIIDALKIVLPITASEGLLITAKSFNEEIDYELSDISQIKKNQPSK